MRVVAKTSLAITALLAITISAPVLAIGAANSHASAHAATLPTAATQHSDPAAQNAVRQTAAQTKLTDAKLRACQNRQTAIDNIMSRIVDRGQKQLDLFTGIANKTEGFYIDKGKTLDNYDALVSDVNANKTAAQTTVDAVKSSSTGFSCDGTDPKGAISSFKSSLQAEIQALKDYKTAVKNLIVGVKSVQGSTASGGNTTTGGNR